MTICTNWYTMDNKSGVALNAVLTSVTVTNNPSQPEYPGLPHALGDRVQGNNGSEWLFVRASATVTAFNFVAINSSYNAANATTALVASNAYIFGFAEFIPTGGVTQGNANGGVANTGDFFWAMLKCAQGARANITTSATTSPGAALYVSGSVPGFITVSADTSAAPGSGRLNGLVFTGASLDTATGTTSIEVGMFSYVMPGVLVSALGRLSI